MAKGIDLFGEETELPVPGIIPGRNKSGGYINNPMHIAHGELKTERCKNCIFLVAKHFSKVYYKCELRGNVDSSSVKSDHRVNWTACGKFEREQRKT